VSAEPGPPGLERARRLLEPGRSVTVLTGAGISTDSGIPDFRGPSGLWTRDPSAERLSSIGAWLSDPGLRRRSWLNLLASGVLAAEPNAAHHALVSLERRGDLVLLVTQNTDGLHLKAGHDPTKVLELHGSTRLTRCRSCGASMPTVEVLERVRAGEEDPACACGGILKRTTVLFGEPLDPLALARAEGAARQCEVLLAVGTTLAVQPAAGLVPLAKNAGAAVVIVNGSETAHDRLADAVVRAPIGEALPALLPPAAAGRVGGSAAGRP